MLVTEPVLDLPILQASYDQIVFEEYEFHSYCRTAGNHTPSSIKLTCVAPALVPWHPDIRGSKNMSECVLVVDSGFSFTHVTPILNGKVIWSAVKRFYSQNRSSCVDLTLEENSLQIILKK